MERELEPALPAPPMVTNNKYGTNMPGKGLSAQKGGRAPQPDKNVIPMGKSLPNDPGKGLGKTSSGSYRS